MGALISNTMQTLSKAVPGPTPPPPPPPAPVTAPTTSRIASVYVFRHAEKYTDLVGPNNGHLNPMPASVGSLNGNGRLDAIVSIFTGQTTSAFSDTASPSPQPLKYSMTQRETSNAPVLQKLFAYNYSYNPVLDLAVGMNSIRAYRTLETIAPVGVALLSATKGKTDASSVARYAALTGECGTTVPGYLEGAGCAVSMDYSGQAVGATYNPGYGGTSTLIRTGNQNAAAHFASIAKTGTDVVVCWESQHIRDLVSKMLSPDLVATRSDLSQSWDTNDFDLVYRVDFSASGPCAVESFRELGVKTAPLPAKASSSILDSLNAEVGVLMGAFLEA